MFELVTFPSIRAPADQPALFACMSRTRQSMTPLAVRPSGQRKLQEPVAAVPAAPVASNENVGDWQNNPDSGVPRLDKVPEPKAELPTSA